MGALGPWLGDLNQIPSLGPHSVGLICIFVSAICGAVIGIERELREKPAGLRTLILIALGATIFTLTSLLLADRRLTADPARLAAQIVPGIGFLGAGAIIRSHGTVIGLTTAATIWAVAAVGVTIGSGHVAAGVAFTAVVFVTLTLMQRLEAWVTGPCRHRRVDVVYRTERGKTLPRLQEILDRYRVPDASISREPRSADEQVLRAPYCANHREHRAMLRELAELNHVVALELDE